MGRYLIIGKDKTAYSTDWFTPEDCWNPKEIRAVVDTYENTVMFDGYTWQAIESDRI